MAVCEGMWSCVQREFDNRIVGQRVIHALIYLAFKERPSFGVVVCVVSRDIWGKMNNRIFKSRDRGLYEVSSLVRFHVSF